jgi:nitronate monooxygenase
MFPANVLNKTLGINFPIVQAPMAGGATTPELVAAVSNAGALGSLGAALLAPDAIVSSISAIRALTDRPFNVNLFVLDVPQPDPDQIARAVEILQPLRGELGLPPSQLPVKYCEDFAGQVEAVLEARVPVVSFTFGIIDEAVAAACKARGTKIIGTATTVAEAKAWESVGADAVCVQGSEAGGHRGTFLGDFNASMIGTMALVPQAADAVSVPVLAAGGIMDGRGIGAAIVLGASGCQLGTAFLTCPEAAIHPGWKSALRGAREDQTLVTRAFTGRPARGLINDYMRRFNSIQHEFPPYPIQMALIWEIRQAAAQANRPELLSLWAGQGAPMSRDLPAAKLVDELMQEAERALNAMSR